MVNIPIVLHFLMNHPHGQFLHMSESDMNNMDSLVQLFYSCLHLMVFLYLWLWLSNGTHNSDSWHILLLFCSKSHCMPHVGNLDIQYKINKKNFYIANKQFYQKKVLYSLLLFLFSYSLLLWKYFFFLIHFYFISLFNFKFIF